MQNSITKQRIAAKYQALLGLMDERISRQWAAAEVAAHCWCGVRAVSEAIGMSPHTIRTGLAELADRKANPGTPIPTRIRHPGGGRKCCTESDPELATALESLVDPMTRGDPQAPLRWTCKSMTQLANELTRQGHPVSPSTVGRLLRAAGYSLQSNRKTKEGDDHPDRNAQFEHINATVKAFQRGGQPVISVDTKKKELVGEFKNGGREWQPHGEPEEVLVHDFLDKELGKAIPYGVYDVTGTRAGSVWASIMTRRGSRRRRSAAGGRRWGRSGIAGRTNCSSRRMAAGATAAGAASGRWPCKTWPRTWG